MLMSPTARRVPLELSKEVFVLLGQRRQLCRLSYFEIEFKVSSVPAVECCLVQPLNATV